MSGLFSSHDGVSFGLSTTGSVGLYATALALAFLSSGHCIGMCGAIAIHAKGPRDRGVPYHVGRFVGYLGIGALTGAFGEAFFSFVGRHPEFEIFALLSVFLLLALQAVAAWSGDPDSTPAAKTYRFFHRQGLSSIVGKLRSLGGFGLGIGTAFLPCGLFISFGLLAAARGSIIHGTILFATLWAGSLPALLATTWGFERFRRSRGRPWVRRVAALVMFGLGLFSLSMRGGGVSPRVTEGVRGVDAVCGHRSFTQRLPSLD